MSKRGRNWGQLLGEYAEVCELAQVLRDIADERQVTIRYLAQQMPYGHTKISQSLNGAKRPEWAFVDVFLRVDRRWPDPDRRLRSCVGRAGGWLCRRGRQRPGTSGAG